METAQPAYSTVIEGIRAGVRKMKGASLADGDIDAATPFWSGADLDQICLGFDSLDLLELVVFLEEEYGWYIPEERIDAAEWHTVGDLASLVLEITHERS